MDTQEQLNAIAQSRNDRVNTVALMAATIFAARTSAGMPYPTSKAVDDALEIYNDAKARAAKVAR